VINAVNAQAPATAQVWDVRYLVDSSGPFAAGPTATAVGITIQARVGIRANTAGSGTNNFGVSRVGASGVFMTFVDPNGNTPNQGSLARGATGETDGGGNALVDTGGNPLAGSFSPFRGSFAPGTAPFFGSNNDGSNGTVGTNASGNPTLASVVGSRAFNFNGIPVGAAATAQDANPANLVGEYANVYRLVYFPKPDFTTSAVRNITVNITGLGVRYLFAFSGSTASAAAAVTLPNTSFTFQVPTPGAAAVLGLGALAAARRRRA
jgi:hypothetical protein